MDRTLRTRRRGAPAPDADGYRHHRLFQARWQAAVDAMGPRAGEMGRLLSYARLLAWEFFEAGFEMGRDGG